MIVVAAKVLNVTLIPGIKLINNNKAKFKAGPTNTLIKQNAQTFLSETVDLNDTLPKVQPIAIQTRGEDKPPKVLTVQYTQGNDTLIFQNTPVVPLTDTTHQELISVDPGIN